MNSKILLSVFFLATSIFAGSATFPDAGSHDATGSVKKIIYTGQGVTGFLNAVYFEVNCGSGCVNTYWLGLEEKNALSIILTAKSMGTEVTVRGTSGTNGWVQLPGTIAVHADILFVP
jgi:hypothetical protein